MPRQPDSVDSLTAPPGPVKRRTWTTKFGPQEPVEPEIPAPYQAWKRDPSPAKLHQVVQHLGPTIDKAVQQFGHTDSPVVRDRAAILAAQAVRTFDPTRGASLDTHVHRQLQTLQRLSPMVSDPMPLPERLRYNRAQVAKAIDHLKNEHGRDVTDEEVAEHLGVPVARVVKVRHLSNPRISQSAMEERDDENDDRPDLVHSSTGPEHDWVDAVYHELDPIDQIILRHRTGYRGHAPLPVQEIAKRVNLSSAAVSQRAGRIQRRLDEFNQRP